MKWIFIYYPCKITTKPKSSGKRAAKRIRKSTLSISNYKCRRNYSTLIISFLISRMISESRWSSTGKWCSTSIKASRKGTRSTICLPTSRKSYKRGSLRPWRTASSKFYTKCQNNMNNDFFTVSDPINGYNISEVRWNCRIISNWVFMFHKDNYPVD